MKRIAALAAFLIMIFVARDVAACGHDGVYLGLGYHQLFLWTPEDRLVAKPGVASPNIHFGPGFGFSALAGYDFCGSRWGIQVPFDYARIRLNHEEWVNYFSQGAEAVVHLATWENGFDIRLVGGLGWAYLSEGTFDDHSKNFGLKGSLGPSFAYYFAKGKVSAAVVMDVPVSAHYFFGSHLSKNHTFVLGIPIRVGMQVGF